MTLKRANVWRREPPHIRLNVEMLDNRLDLADLNVGMLDNRHCSATLNVEMLGNLSCEPCPRP